MKRNKARAAALTILLSFLLTACGSAAESESWSRQFSTDFSRSSIDYAEVISGGPPRDGIPAIDHPVFVSVDEAREWLDGREPVLVVEWTEERKSGKEVKIYPLQILTWHEIVNDRMAGDPVTVTYCPLCNTGIVFLARTGSGEFDFGVSGMLRYSNMIMYDRQTESWWQQATGEAVAGALTGEILPIIPSLYLSFEDARIAYPEAAVLSRRTGFDRPYGSNPYAGYDSLDRPFLYQGPETDTPAGMMEQVLAVKAGGETRAVSYTVLREEGVVQFILGGRSIVVFWKEGTASALDSRTISLGRDTGSANAFFAEADGNVLDFRKSGSGFSDLQTGSTWSITGTAVGGSFQGSSLVPAEAVQHFRFSYNAFSGK